LKKANIHLSSEAIEFGTQAIILLVFIHVETFRTLEYLPKSQCLICRSSTYCRVIWGKYHV